MIQKRPIFAVQNTKKSKGLRSAGKGEASSNSSELAGSTHHQNENSAECHAFESEALGPAAVVTSAPRESLHDKNISEVTQILFPNHQKAHFPPLQAALSEDSDGDDGDGSDIDGDDDDLESALRKLNKIDKKIKRGGLSKKDRRLLQNRKSALKCRIKKEQEETKVRRDLDKLSEENEELRK